MQYKKTLFHTIQLLNFCQSFTILILKGPVSSGKFFNLNSLQFSYETVGETIHSFSLLFFSEKLKPPSKCEKVNYFCKAEKTESGTETN